MINYRDKLKLTFVPGNKETAVWLADHRKARLDEGIILKAAVKLLKIMQRSAPFSHEQQPHLFTVRSASA